MIVVDTNVIAYLLLPSERSQQAELALLKDSAWAAPALWRSELRNVLAHYVRRTFLSLDEAQAMMDEALDLMRGREYEIASAAVLGLAARSHCTAYDCEFVSLAQELDVPLVTVDKQILSEFPAVAVSLEIFVVA
jgi:predicted nucleic acid-binding protein